MARIADAMQPLHINDPRPIGIFDSGVGGLSVWIEIRSQMPNESTLYFADQIHVPYGERSLLEVRLYSAGITEFLLEQRTKIIVVACNTASGAALKYLRLHFPQTCFVGMEPAVKPAVQNTRTGHIGVIATPTTFQGILYKELVQRFGRDVSIHTQICPGLVEVIEEGRIHEKSTFDMLEKCLTPLKQKNIDQLVLGCTHYPFIVDIAQKILGEDINLINPAPAVARQTGRLLEKQALYSSPNHTAEHVFYTTNSVSKLAEISHALVGYNGQIKRATWMESKLSSD